MGLLLLGGLPALDLDDDDGDVVHGAVLQREALELLGEDGGALDGGADGVRDQAVRHHVPQLANVSTALQA